MTELPIHPALKSLLLSPAGTSSHYKSTSQQLGLTNFSESTLYLSETNPDSKGPIHFFLRAVNKTYHTLRD